VRQTVVSILVCQPSRTTVAENGRLMGSPAILVIQAHQESILDPFIRPSSDVLVFVHSSAIPESPN